MGNNNFLIFDENKINMMDDATYSNSGYRLDGANSGIAPSNIHNKVYHQATMFISAFAQSLADKGYNVSDSDFNALKAVFNNINTNTTNNYQLFTSSGTFTVPNNARQLILTLCGGGGGGSSFFACGGGGAQSVQQMVVAVTPGQTFDVTVGIGGLGGFGPVSTIIDGPPYSTWKPLFNANIMNGTNGASSSFGNLATALGGKGALAYPGTQASPGDRGGFGGTPGSMPNVYLFSSGTVFSRAGGRGGDSLLGQGGTGGIYAVASPGPTRAGSNGIGYGSGGGGGADDWNTSTNTYKATAGGNGAPGVVLVEW